MNRLGLLLLSVAFLFVGCGGSAPSDSNSGATAQAIASPSPTPSPLSEFEEDLQYVRNGQYSYIWLFSRKDGKLLDSADGNFLRTSAPQVVDWVKTDGGRKVFGGTNFNLEEGNMEALKKRFVVEDYTGK